jgi:septum formation protein
MAKIILATSSPSRKEAFSFLGLDFDAKDSNVDEYFEGRPDSPEELVLHLARLKAEAIAKEYKKEIIIGFDTVGSFKDKILEKPKSRKEAFERLRLLSGNTHLFYTGIHMINLESGKTISKVVITKVKVRNLKDFEIERYLNQDSKFNTYALGFDPLGHYSSTFVREIEGSYNNMTRGIPLEIVVEMLSLVGYKL